MRKARNKGLHMHMILCVNECVSKVGGYVLIRLLPALTEGEATDGKSDTKESRAVHKADKTVVITNLAKCHDDCKSKVAVWRLISLERTE